ncbi:MAG: hypothetical protein IJS00_06985 [Paludibacteraceae bacterium]|nr:hypothetical protein [Paludibacteraceae bacterium]
MKHTTLYTSVIIGLSLFTAFCLSSCKRTGSSTQTYDPTDATVRAFAFAANSNYPGLAAASFVVENLSDTGRIAVKNNDSLMYGTSLEKVRPLVSYNSRPAGAICYVGDTSYILTNYDTLDLSKKPVLLRVFAADRTHEKYYRIILNVHQADPDVYTWQCLNEQITPAVSAEQQALYDGKQFLFYTNNSQTTTLATSADGVNWTEQTVSGLPGRCHVKQLLFDSLKHLFIYAQDTAYYLSEDGKSWEENVQENAQYRILSLWTTFNNEIWASVQHRTDGLCAIATLNTETMELHPYINADINDLPISDFSTVNFLSSAGRPHALIAGGYTKNGKMIGTHWAIEAINGNYRLVRMHDISLPIKPFAGAAIINYNNRLQWYGGVNADYTPFTKQRYSLDEGMTWIDNTDTIHYLLPEGYSNRWQSSIIMKDNNIYLFGGRTADNYFTDIYSGRLNSIDW